MSANQHERLIWNRIMVLSAMLVLKTTRFKFNHFVLFRTLIVTIVVRIDLSVRMHLKIDVIVGIMILVPFIIKETITSYPCKYK